MKRTSGKAASPPILLGDPQTAEIFAQALADAADVDRWTHGFHTWPAGLHPDAAARLVAAFESDAVLDPFCGGGTVLVEARAAGRLAIGRDISPVAVRVARARTATPDDATLTRFRSRARKLTAEAREATELPPDRILNTVREWYAPYVLWELERIRTGIEESDPDVRPLLEVAFSSLLVKVSWRRSDTSAHRMKHDRPKGTAAILFHKKVRELARRMTALREAVPEGTAPADVSLFDARRLEIRRPVGLVLTSPPYPSTYDYLSMQHLRSVWLGDEPAKGREIGARKSWRDGDSKARKKWKADTDAWMAKAAEALVPGGRLVVVIGDGLTPSGAIDTSGPSADGARRAGLRMVARASVERVDHARESARWEHVMAWEKPD